MIPGGGHLIINNNFLNDTRTGSPFSVLHNLSSVVLWDGGMNFTHSELAGLLAGAGFTESEPHPIMGGSAHVVVAVK